MYTTYPPSILDTLTRKFHPKKTRWPVDLAISFNLLPKQQDRISAINGNVVDHELLGEYMREEMTLNML